MMQTQTPRRRRLIFMTLAAVGIVGLVGALVAILLAGQASAAPSGPTWPSLLPDSGCNYTATLSAHYEIKTSMMLTEAGTAYAERLADQGWSVDVKKAGDTLTLNAVRGSEKIQVQLALSGSTLQAEMTGDAQCYK